MKLALALRVCYRQTIVFKSENNLMFHSSVSSSEKKDCMSQEKSHHPHQLMINLEDMDLCYIIKVLVLKCRADY